MAFLDTTFPRNVSAGVSGGPERRVDIVQLASGAEERNARWKHSRRSYDASLGIRDADDLKAVVALFEEAGGPLHSFRFRDWSDFSSAASTRQDPGHLDQVIGTGDGSQTAFQLVKTYGGLAPYVREITKPVPGSVVVSLGGVLHPTGWAVDHLTGLITFTAAPAPGAEIRAGYLFDVPVRFDAQELHVSMAFSLKPKGAASAPSRKSR